MSEHVLTLGELLGSTPLRRDIVTNPEGEERHAGRDISISESVKDLLTLVRADKIKNSGVHQQALRLTMDALKRQEKALLRTKERAEASVMEGFKAVGADDL